MQLRNCCSSFLLVIFLSNQVSARFTLDTCWYKDCILRTAQNSMCYVPDGTAAVTPCSGSGHADLATVFQTHLQQDLSIAYYNGVDNTRLGGVDFDVPSDGSIVRLCLSGQAVGGSNWTLCLNAMGDNVLSGSPVFCKLHQVPTSVSDGCYSISATNPTLTSSTATSTVSNSAVSGKGLQKTFILYSFLFLLDVQLPILSDLSLGA